MIECKLVVKESLGKGLGGLGRVFSRKGREAGREMSGKDMAEPRDEAEEALWQAMGCNEPQGGNPLRVAADGVKEALAER